MRNGLVGLAAAFTVLGLAAAAEAAGPFQYHAVTPCRAIDTRDGTGTTAGARPNPGPHTFRLQGKCGIPAGAKAVTANFSVITPTTGGDLRVFPSDVGTPLVAVMSYGFPEPALCNGAIVPLAQVAGDDIAVQIGMACGGNGCGSIQMTIDVTGYFD